MNHDNQQGEAEFSTWSRITMCITTVQKYWPCWKWPGACSKWRAECSQLCPLIIRQTAQLATAGGVWPGKVGISLCLAVVRLHLHCCVGFRGT